GFPVASNTVARAGEPSSDPVANRSTPTSRALLESSWPTITVKGWVVVPPLASVAVTVMTAVPVRPFTEVKVIVRFVPLPPRTMFPFGIRAWLSDVAETAMLAGGVWSSATVNPTGPTVNPVVVVWVGIGLSVVAAFGCGLTVTRKLVVVVPPLPSATVTVTVVVPFWPAGGSTVLVRFAPLPPRTMFPFGTSVGLLDVGVTVKLAGGVWSSPTVNPTGPTGTPVV